MQRLTIFRALLAVWVLWHLVFGLLSTFAPETGARVIGWTAQGGWDSTLITMSTQYGMVMLLLAGVYLLMALEPLRYLGMTAVAIAEQVLGIAYAFYIYAQFGQLTIAQLLIQGAINVVVIVLFALFWSGLREQAVTFDAGPVRSP